MEKIYKRSVHIFRRDLRLSDNRALMEAAVTSAEVIPCFIFDERQYGQTNAYRSENALAFMLASLRELDAELRKKGSRLFLFRGNPENVVERLIKEERIDSVFVNRDYTPFSIRRDAGIEKVCKKCGVKFYSMADALLHEPEEMMKQDMSPYVVFTAFMKHTMPMLFPVPDSSNTHYVFSSERIAFEESIDIYQKLFSNIENMHNAGRGAGLKRLTEAGKLVNYSNLRDYPAEDATSKLSPHNKFGTVSIREVYHALKANLGAGHELLKQLVWRDFFTHVAFNFPHVFEGAFRKEYNALKWSEDEKSFNAWTLGKTGFPIVDAGMRELNSTGIMHNRVRMITASFLVKDLHISWREGEKYFAAHLTDYDPCLNNGNWQWCASSGCDAQPYFRIFNPWLQQKKFDSECLYIKKWLPELRKFSAAEIHNILKRPLPASAYPRPMIDHAEEAALALLSYKKLKQIREY